MKNPIESASTQEPKINEVKDGRITKPSIIARFAVKVDASGGPDACHLWLGSVNKNGYGRFKVGPHYPIASRAAFRIHRGPIPEGMCVCHKCDNPSCMNPLHLWLGTDADNVADRHAKKRDARGDNHGLRLHPERRARGKRQGAYTCPEMIRKGVLHGNAKLDDDKVREIRSSSDTHKTIAAKFGIHHATVQRIRAGHGWKHVK